MSPADARRWPKRKLQIKTKIMRAVSKTVANHNQKDRSASHQNG